MAGAGIVVSTAAPKRDGSSCPAGSIAEGEAHPASGLDEIVHQRSRLGILAILREADRVEFGYLRNALELSDGNLSRHLRTLEDAGFIEIHKGYQGRRPRTWLRLTRVGRRALDRELTALRALVSRIDSSSEHATAVISET
jgi:DNA-binding MarR family transcriptional regulator